MTKDEQLRYLERLYGDVEDGNCTLTDMSVEMDINGGKEIRLSVVYSRSAQVNQAPAHNHSTYTIPSNTHDITPSWMYITSS